MSTKRHGKITVDIGQEVEDENNMIHSLLDNVAILLAPDMKAVENPHWTQPLGRHQMAAQGTYSTLYLGSLYACF